MLKLTFWLVTCSYLSFASTQSTYHSPAVHQIVWSHFAQFTISIIIIFHSGPSPKNKTQLPPWFYVMTADNASSRDLPSKGDNSKVITSQIWDNSCLQYKEYKTDQFCQTDNLHACNWPCNFTVISGSFNPKLWNTLKNWSGSNFEPNTVQLSSAPHPLTIYKSLSPPPKPF